MNDDDDSDAADGDVKAFSSDDEFAEVDTSKVDNNSSGGSNMFDSLKVEDSPPKKATNKRKLAPKVSSAKRPKSAIIDSDSDSDFGARV